MAVVVLPAVVVAALVVVVSAQAHLKVTDMSAWVGDGNENFRSRLTRLPTACPVCASF